jgi:hypothetical protein
LLLEEEKTCIEYGALYWPRLLDQIIKQLPHDIAQVKSFSPMFRVCDFFLFFLLAIIRGIMMIIICNCDVTYKITITRDDDDDLRAIL